MTLLNKQQYLASLPAGGISLVIAGAGTGKTKTIIEKVKNIINHGIAEPEDILILTFSNKAAQEIKERVKSGISSDADGIRSGTFHSFCLNLLRENTNAFIHSSGFKHFPEVIDQEEKNKLQMDLLRNSKDRFLGIPLDVASGLLENRRLDQHSLRKLDSLGIIKELDDFEQRFRQYKISHNLIDFSDMMRFAIDMLSNNKTIREQAVNTYKYILIDEFQDTSEDNLKLIKLMMDEKNPNLFLVGDDWQSIYGFRGSRIDYIVRLRKYFPDAVIYKLSVNYRSKKEIIKLSNNFIRKNKYRTRKKLKAVRGGGGTIKNFCVNSIDEEVSVIRSILEKDKINLDDTALIYRNNWQEDYIRKKLTIDGSPKVDVIKYMTMHSSKGLEFGSVIIAGLSDKIIPDASADIEEERRLLYVALTRAKDNLYIVHHKSADGSLSLFASELGLEKS